MNGLWQFGFDPRICKRRLPRKSNIAGRESRAHWCLKRQLARAVLAAGWRVAFEVSTPARVVDVVGVNADRVVGLEAVCSGERKYVCEYTERARTLGFPLFCFSMNPGIVRWGDPLIIDARSNLDAMIAALLANVEPYKLPLPKDYWNYTFPRLSDYICNMPRRVPVEMLDRLSRVYQHGLHDKRYAKEIAFFLSNLPTSALARLKIDPREVSAAYGESE